MTTPAPIIENQPLLLEIWEQYGGMYLSSEGNDSPIESKQTIDVSWPTKLTPEDDAVVQRIMQSEKCGPEFQLLGSALCFSQKGDHPSESEVDLALVGTIACFTREADQIERIWLSTPQGQRDEKRRDRADYRARTIRKVLSSDYPRVRIIDLDATSSLNSTDAPPTAFAATPFSLAEAQTVPMRDFIYDKFYLREIVSITAAPGGVGKSSLVMTEALAMASCKNLLGTEVMFQTRVWYWNGEDTRAELMRRFMGIAKFYGLEQSDFNGFLFVDSGHDVQIVMAETTKNGTVINVPVIENLVQVIRENQLDVLIIDPFISSHNVPENDNSTIDKVVKLYGRIAAKEGISIMLVHHSRKLNGKEGTGDDIRGGGAIRDAVRSARILHPMSDAEAGKHGIEDFTSYFYATDDKQNFAKRSNVKQFYRMENVRLDNGLFRNNDGDLVGVVTQWMPQRKTTEITEEQKQRLIEKLGGRAARHSSQSPAWVGYIVADALGMNIEEDGNKQLIKHRIAQWIINGAMERYIETHGGQDRPMVRVVDFEKLCPPLEK